MKAIEPTTALEKRLVKKENLKLATQINCNWQENNCVCDICKRKITGRHMVDGLRKNTMEFALMCAQCHFERGSGFGVGKGQLYTKLQNGKWLLSLGFSKEQLMETADDDDDDGFPKINFKLD